ncbi:helix-turn-helix domain-containing protein [Psychrobacter sp. HD31]|uniref:IclR family transcriptional regulator n=1 Tax=Psychrobacter sp. HD31 TaxID=3112003 RepID=UPI003DA2A2D2
MTQNTTNLSIENLQNSDKKLIASLVKGLVVLNCFKDGNHKLTHQQVCNQTGLPKATATRLLYTLVYCQYLTHNKQTGDYYLGKQALKMGGQIAMQSDISQLALPLLKQFAQKYETSVNIASHQAGMMQYLACYRSPSRISVNLKVGSQVPLEQTAIGRAFYACASTEVKQAITHHLQQRISNKTDYENAIDLLEKQEQQYQKQGFSISSGDYSSEILAVAVAIKNGERLFAVNASVPSSYWKEDDLINKIVPALKDLANQISEIIQ